jgi:NAD(P)-dependent dehydrogenase (short-subunit alcohol dehydrogenase family)
MGNLEGRVVIVTGAGSSIGLEMTKRFTEAGASVVASDESEEGLKRWGGRRRLQRESGRVIR